MDRKLIRYWVVLGQSRENLVIAIRATGIQNENRSILQEKFKGCLPQILGSFLNTLTHLIDNHVNCECFPKMTKICKITLQIIIFSQMFLPGNVLIFPKTIFETNYRTNYPLITNYSNFIQRGLLLVYSLIIIKYTKE